MSCFVQSHTVSFGHCHSNPGHLHTVSCLNQCCDHATRATMGLEFVVLAERLLDRTAIRVNNEAIGMELFRCQLTHRYVCGHRFSFPSSRSPVRNEFTMCWSCQPC